MSNKLTGVVYSIGNTQQVSEKFAKREVVILDESGKYPNHILFQFTQDKCNELDNIALGQEVEISYNLSGRLWIDPNTGVEKCFNTLSAWRIEGTVITPPSIISSDSYAFSATVGGTATTPAVQTSAQTIATADDQDLPF